MSCFPPNISEHGRKFIHTVQLVFFFFLFQTKFANFGVRTEISQGVGPGPNLCMATFFYVLADIWNLSGIPIAEKSEGQQGSEPLGRAWNPSIYQYFETLLLQFRAFFLFYSIQKHYFASIFKSAIRRRFGRKIINSVVLFFPFLELAKVTQTSRFPLASILFSTYMRCHRVKVPPT